MATEREIERARRLRQDATNAEVMLWQRLRSRQLAGVKFRRQVPIAGYTVDFACLSPRVAIELDGGQHAASESDAVRTCAIEAAGFLLVRFWNNEVVENIEGTLADIVAHLRIAEAG